MAHEWARIICLFFIAIGVWRLGDELRNMSGIFMDWLDEEKEAEDWE